MSAADRWRLDPSFWQDRRVFVTGHTGFIGGWLTAWLAEMGATIHGYALTPNTEPNFYSALKIEQLCDQTIDDVRDFQALNNAIASFQPEIVLHLAAQPLVRESYEDPVGTYATNVMGTVHILEACRSADSVRAIVNFTSDKCYENREWVWGYREIDALGGYDPYSSSKGASELVTNAYRRSFFNLDKYNEHGVALASVRSGNVIGGGDWSKFRLIPDAVRAYANGDALIVHQPDAIRPWQHVLEPLCGLLMLSQACIEDGPSYSCAWNFGPEDGQDMTAGEVVAGFTEAWGDGSRWEEKSAPDQPHEAEVLRLDCSLARRRLGWTPALDLATALALAVDWYKAFYSEQDSQGMRGLTAGQIRTHFLN